MTETKATQRAKVQRTNLADAIELLQSAPDKEKDEFSLRESIFQMRDQIKGVLAKGYNYDAVAKMLAKTGIDIKGATLRQYMTSARSKKRTKRIMASERSQPSTQQNQAIKLNTGKHTETNKQELRNTNTQVTNSSSMVEVSNRFRKTAEDEFNDY